MSGRVAAAWALLPEYLAWHVLLSASALVLGLVISLPLAVAASRSPRLRWPVLAVAGLPVTGDEHVEPAGIDERHVGHVHDDVALGEGGGELLLELPAGVDVDLAGHRENRDAPVLAAGQCEGWPVHGSTIPAAGWNRDRGEWEGIAARKLPAPRLRRRGPDTHRCLRAVPCRDNRGRGVEISKA